MEQVVHGEVVESHEIVRASEVPASSRIVARVNVRIREGTIEDLAFIDRLQKQHSRELGFLPTAALEGKIGRGEVLVAERIEPRSHGGTARLSRNQVSECNTTNPLKLQKDDLEERSGASLSASVSRCLRG